MSRFHTKCGQVVKINHFHLRQHEDVKPFLAEALDAFDYSALVPGEVVRCEIDLGRTIGLSGCVETRSGDYIRQAIRKGRKWPTRFVMNPRGRACSKVTVVMLGGKPNRYDSPHKLLTAYIGYIAEREVGDHSIATDAEREAAVAFWRNHAIVWDGNMNLIDEIIKDEFQI